LNEPDLSAESHSLALTVQAPEAPVTFHAMFNAYWEPLIFELPHLGPRRAASWRRWIDTHRDAPDDVCDAPLAAPVEALSYTVRARSVVVLFALRDETTAESRRGTRDELAY
jgi:glycogen operon protein